MFFRMCVEIRGLLIFFPECPRCPSGLKSIEKMSVGRGIQLRERTLGRHRECVGRGVLNTKDPSHLSAFPSRCDSWRHAACTSVPIENSKEKHKAFDKKLVERAEGGTRRAAQSDEANGVERRHAAY